MSQLPDWKGHTCALRENHVCFGRIQTRQPVERGSECSRATHTYTLASSPPSHHCLDGEVYRGNRHYNVCEHHVGLDTNQSLHHPPERTRPNTMPYRYGNTRLPWYCNSDNHAPIDQCGHSYCHSSPVSSYGNTMVLEYTCRYTCTYKYNIISQTT